MKTKLLIYLAVIVSFQLQSQVTFGWAKNTVYDGFPQVYSLTRDAIGNIWTTGFFQGLPDMDPGAGTFNLSTTNCCDSYVSKLDANGNFLWAGQIGNGGPNMERANDLVTDPSGNAYITGHYVGNNCDFDPGAGVNIVPSLGTDGFILKLNASGAFQWVITFETSGFTSLNSISIDGSGNLYVIGRFSGMIDVDPGFGTTWYTASGSDDIIVIKVDQFGSLLWAKQIGGSNLEAAYSSDLDASGNIHVAGTFSGTVDFDPNAGTQNLTSSGGEDVYILKLDASGNYVWGKNIGGTQSEVVYSIDVDPSGNVYSVGTFSATSDFDPGAATVNLTTSGADDVFISKLDASGNYVWAKKFGGTSGDYGYSIVADATSNIYTAGSFVGIADFDPGAGTFNMTSAGAQDMFVTKLNSAGNFINAIRIGSTNGEEAYCQVVDPIGNLYFSGSYYGSTIDFDPGPGTFTLSTSTSFQGNVFLEKLAIGPLAVEEIKSSTDFRMFPNPTGRLLTIVNSKNEIGVIEIYNVLGEVIFKEEVNENKIEIDLSKQASGIYFVKTGNTITKIIKE